MQFLAHTFNILKSLVSRYDYIYVSSCKRNWMDAKHRTGYEHYASVFQAAIIDAYEIFVEMPSDLHTQSSTTSITIWLHAPQMVQFHTSPPWDVALADLSQN